MIVCNVLKGIGLGMSGGMALGMVADTITYGQIKSGINTVDTVGMGNEGVSAAQQPGSVAAAIQFLYTWLSMVMCLIVLVIMIFFYNIEKDLAKMQSGN